MTASALALSLFAVVAGTQDPVTYEIWFDNAVHHEARIEVTFPDLPAGPLHVRMSRSSPGRYALHEFAKNVYDVQAWNGAGDRLEITRPNPHQWDVPGHDGTVRIHYTLYGARADGTYTGIDETHAHLNMPATFLWARGLRDRPVQITFLPPEGAGWRIATQLATTTDPYTFAAPDLDYFLDSPTELSRFTLRQWEVRSERGDVYTIRLAVHHAGSDGDVDRYVELAQPVVREARAVFGEYPRFDYGVYTFIADYLPHVHGDGMEHRNSTILSSTASLARSAVRLLRTLSHEFLHAWNVERMRPATLEPFDFEHANMSRELWFAEGFTSYYDDLLIRRAGIIDDADYARGLGGGLTEVIHGPGRRFFSPVEMSMRAPFVDAATSIDPTNHENTFISYYTWGAALGLGLDLTLRSRFDLTLDDYMRGVWQEYGTSERPYTVDDLQRALADLTGDPGFAAAFFDRYVRGRDVLDYEELLGHAGFALRRSNPGQAVLGRVQLRYDDRGAEVTSATLIGSPLYEAGVDRGDLLLSLVGRRITGPDELRAALAARQPGDTISLEFESQGGRRTVRVVLGENPMLEVVPYEAIDRPLTPELRAFRSAWLGSNAR